MNHHKNQRALKQKRAQMELRERLLRQQQIEKASGGSGGNYLTLDEQTELQMLQMMSGNDSLVESLVNGVDSSGAGIMSPSPVPSLTMNMAGGAMMIQQHDETYGSKRASLGSARLKSMVPSSTSGDDRDSTIGLRRSETITTNLNPAGVVVGCGDHLNDGGKFSTGENNISMFCRKKPTSKQKIYYLKF